MANRYRPLMNVFMIAFLLAITISGCAQKDVVNIEAAPLKAVISSLPQRTPTTSSLETFPMSAPASATVIAATPISLEPAASTSGNEGLMIFSMADGKYWHLYAYHPVDLPLSRLTAGDWNHADPAISPDGMKLAYCADEFGRWDIFILDLVSGEKSRLTETETYSCSPTWSPDGRWLAFEEILDGKLNLVIRSIIDESTAPVRLTNNGGNNFNPAWSPGGREIAFDTDRNGRIEIWLANLDAPDQRFQPVARADDADHTSPAWSADGSALAWSKKGDFEEIQALFNRDEDTKPMILGTGADPAWMENTKGVAAVVNSPNGNDLVVYSDDPTHLVIPPIHLQNEVSSLAWISGTAATQVKNYLADSVKTGAEPLWQPQISTQDTSSGRFENVYLEGVQAPEPYLSDTVNESFAVMRSDLQEELGWDFLKILESASASIPANAQPGLDEDWLYTGRAIAVNLDPLNAGWMVVNREDINGRTYWRVWLKCFDQDGSCGVPIEEPVWDFNARLNGDANTYENGGATASIPQGFWLDFTSFARKYGWLRLPSKSNWGSYFPAAQLNQFVLQDGLSWHEAMKERFTMDTIQELWPSP